MKGKVSCYVLMTATGEGREGLKAEKNMGGKETFTVLLNEGAPVIWVDSLEMIH